MARSYLDFYCSWTALNNMANLENYFQESRGFLEDFIDPDSGLIEKLFSKGILDRREMKKIEAKDTYFNRNSLILDKISEKRKIPELCTALRDTGQQHIANYLDHRGSKYVFKNIIFF